MKTTLRSAWYYAFSILSLVILTTFFLLTHPVVHMLADIIIPVH